MFLFFLERSLLFEGHALLKYIRTYYFRMVLPYPNIWGWGVGDVWCLVVFGVIWVFRWCFVRFGSFGGVWCDFGVLWFLYKIHGFRQGILCFGNHVIFEWVGTLGQGDPIKFVTFAYFLYVLHRVFPIPKDRPEIGSKLISFNFVTIHPISP